MSGQREATEAGMRAQIAVFRDMGPGTFRRTEALILTPVLAAAVERVLDLCDEWDRDGAKCRPSGDFAYELRAALLGES